MGKKLGLVLACILIFFVLGCQQAARKPDAPSEKLGQEPVISLYLHETGETKEIPIEEYLQGVVAAEMDPNWPEEALAAQAILARTFTMKKIEEGGVKEHGTDASTDVEEFQAYDPERINDKVRRAVERTRGEVVTYQGKYINAWFHADSGGKTAASAVEGLEFRREPAPYIKSVEDPGHAITVPENKSWTATFTKEEVRQAVQKALGTDPGPVTRVEIVKRGPSGRVTSVKVNETILSGPALRLALGSEVMRSTLLDEIRVEQAQVVIRGKGYGHGVGMSQWGARALAEQGKKAEEIVRYFFRDVEIEKRW
ncbi:MAG TPA: SpoIID/LytB domain-containing protein [Clostridia bacterium]|nr:SpoIID/LytB domain-containing protein [Clostridia bacterium]